VVVVLLSVAILQGSHTSQQPIDVCHPVKGTVGLVSLVFTVFSRDLRRGL